MGNSDSNAVQQPESGQPAPAAVPAPAASDSIWERIKRHKVVEWTLAYIAFAYALLHGVQMLRETFEWPLLVSRVTVVALAAGVPVAATLAWYHGHRALRRVSGAEVTIFALLLVGAGSAVWWLSRDHEAAGSALNAARVSAKPVVRAEAFSPPAHSVAVMPFSNLSGDQRQEYFSDGVSEELINALSHIEGLKVSARTSSFSFKGQNVDIGAIARRLNVATVLEGSVRRSGKTVRITAQLINAETGFHLWSDSYDRDLTDMLSLQSDIATHVAQQLRVRLLTSDVARIAAGGTRNAAAYDAYLRGTQLSSTAENTASHRAALAALDEAVQADPDFANAHAARAGVLINLTYYTENIDQRAELVASAFAAAQHAVELAPESADAHGSLAFTYVWRGDFDSALREIERAVSLDPGSARVQNRLATLNTILGHYDASIAAHERAIELDPQNYRWRVNLALALYNAHRFAQARRAAEEARSFAATALQAQWVIAASHLALGDANAALQLCENPISLGEPDRHTCLVIALWALGKQSDSDEKLDQLRRISGETGAFNYALIYAQRGDSASALKWLEVAERQHAPDLVWIKSEPLLDPIRKEPEFKALERRLNIPP